MLRGVQRPVLLVSLALVTGAGWFVLQRDPEVDTGAGRDAPPAGELALSPTQGRSALQEKVAYKLDALDPARDGWSSEVFSGRAGAQLKLVAQALGQAQAISAEALTELVDASFRCGELRPGELRLAFDDGALKVSHGTAAPSVRRVGVAGLVEALRELSAPYRSEARVLLKIIGVEPLDAGFETRVYFRAFASTDAGTVQQNGRWRCRWTAASDDEAPRLTEIALSEYEEVEGRASPRFEDCTRAVLGGNASFEQQLVPGIAEWSGALDRSLGLSFFGHEGLAVGDVNGDGRDDLYVCQGGGLPNRLYVQDEAGRARDVSGTSGVDYLDLTHSALLVDLDGDGDQDLVAATDPVTIHANDGAGRFTRVAEFETTIVYALAAADYDDDGDLDLYLCCYAAEAYETAPIPYHDANNGPANTLLRNDGGWRFTDVTREVGLDANNRRFSFAASWFDYDEDGDADLYVANDYGRNNLYRNEGGRFEDVAAQAGVEDLSAGMSVSWGDADGDGDFDLYVGNMFSSAGNRIAYQRQFKGDADAATLAQLQRHARGNSLFENAGDGSFRDVSVESGASLALWAWGSRFVDVDNDGLEDLVVANGMVTGSDPEDL